MGFRLDQYNKRLFEWIATHQTMQTLENIDKIKPKQLEVEHIRVAMERFLADIKDSPQYGTNKNRIDRDINETRNLYEAFFGVYTA